VEAADLAWAYIDPKSLGFDAAVEFPPHNAGASIPPPEPLTNPNFRGLIFNYEDVTSRYINAPVPEYLRYRTVMLGWDNTARRQDRSAIFIGCTPSTFKRWLQAVLSQAMEMPVTENRLVFINAWNEWAEGTYLEPDDRYGRGFKTAKAELHASEQAVGQDPASCASARRPEGPTSYLRTPLFVQPTPENRHQGVEYLDFLSFLNTTLRPRSFFEIGTHAGNSLRSFTADAVCVDPQFLISEGAAGARKRTLLYQMSSDDFFLNFDLHDHFPIGVDIMFLDGLHLCEVLLRDFLNAERFTHARSIILLHDCLPLNARMAERVLRDGGPEEGDLRFAWTGDVWKVIPMFKKYRPDLNIRFLDCPPTGLVVIQHTDSGSEVLRTHYASIIEEMNALSLEEMGLAELWRMFPTLSSYALFQNPELATKEFGLFEEQW